MLPKDLFAKIKRIEITTSRLVSDVFAGAYHSVFKGQGIEFDEVREYRPGDDIRTIDWNVTARTGRAHVKKFVEERELSVMILVDVSRSCRFASTNSLKSQLAAEISALLSLSATRNNDKVGMILFTDKIEKFMPPRKGMQHVLRSIREILYFKPEGKSTDMIQALDYLNKTTTRRTITFIVSDFIDVARDQDLLKRKLAVANKRHDVIAIVLEDPKERSLPDCGILALEDAETGELVYVDSSNEKVRSQYHQNNEFRRRKRTQMFQSMGMDCVELSTETSYSDELVKFFIRRKKKRL